MMTILVIFLKVRVEYVSVYFSFHFVVVVVVVVVVVDGKFCTSTQLNTIRLRRTFIQQR